MKEDDEVVVRVYTNELEAEMAASWLDAEGIPYEVLTDDAGGTLPNLLVTRGVKLVVDRANEERANEILDRGEEEVDPSILASEEAAGSGENPDEVPTREIRRDDASE
jgi:hypothetical protein